ncbi:hypothetical protein GQX74_005875 [Glossina fuscipes]|nr:hypothetical protein GQX74_005875 [Glossina fuscipes]
MLDLNEKHEKLIASNEGHGRIYQVNGASIYFMIKGYFEGLKLRGAKVIDPDNITDNDQIEQIFLRSSKHPGVSAFTKYHYELFNILHRLNFPVKFRNARGWAGHLHNSSYPLGFLGIMQRNGADIDVSLTKYFKNELGDHSFNTQL